MVDKKQLPVLLNLFDQQIDRVRTVFALDSSLQAGNRVKPEGY